MYEQCLQQYRRIQEHFRQQSAPSQDVEFARSQNIEWKGEVFDCANCKSHGSCLTSSGPEEKCKCQQLFGDRRGPRSHLIATCDARPGVLFEGLTRERCERKGYLNNAPVTAANTSTMRENALTDPVGPCTACAVELRALAQEWTLENVEQVELCLQNLRNKTKTAIDLPSAREEKQRQRMEFFQDPWDLAAPANRQLLQATTRRRTQLRNERKGKASSSSSDKSKLDSTQAPLSATPQRRDSSPLGNVDWEQYVKAQDLVIPGSSSVCSTWMKTALGMVLGLAILSLMGWLLWKNAKSASPTKLPNMNSNAGNTFQASQWAPNHLPPIFQRAPAFSDTLYTL